jgi:hypothetical protein
MKSLAQLDQLNLDADTKQQVVGIVQTLLDQAEHAQQEIRTQALKIQALTMELAHLRRIRFGKKNESLSTEQLSLFEESVLADIAAVDTEIEQIDSTAKTTATNHRAPAQAANRCRIICRALNTGMNRHPANADSVATNWSKLVRT